MKSNWKVIFDEFKFELTWNSLQRDRLVIQEANLSNSFLNNLSTNLHASLLFCGWPDVAIVDISSTGVIQAPLKVLGEN